jgi:hypothetical protein
MPVEVEIEKIKSITVTTGIDRKIVLTRDDVGANKRIKFAINGWIHGEGGMPYLCIKTEDALKMIESLKELIEQEGS